jgi:hypothetical protein
MELHKSKVVSLKSHPTMTEKWLQDEIIKDPTILGLRDVIVRSQGSFSTKSQSHKNLRN